MVRILMERRCVVPLTLNDSDDRDDYDGSSVRKLSYLKLPQTRLRLSVLKLDGSLFDVHIERNASVAELKQAIEEVFTLSPREVQGKISWIHVWGHFCLCYDGQKLVNDKAHVQDFRIKDGDQLQFIQHMSIDYLHSKRRYKIQRVANQQYSMSSLRSDACEDDKHDVLANKDNLEDQDIISSSATDANEEKKQSDLFDKDILGNLDDCHKYYQHHDYDEIPAPEFKLGHFLRGWLSYSRLRSVSRKTLEGKSRPSRFGLFCIGGAPLGFYNFESNYYYSA